MIADILSVGSTWGLRESGPSFNFQVAILSHSSVHPFLALAPPITHLRKGCVVWIMFRIAALHAHAISSKPPQIIRALYEFLSARTYLSISSTAISTPRSLRIRFPMSLASLDRLIFQCNLDRLSKLVYGKLCRRNRRRTDSKGVHSTTPKQLIGRMRNDDIGLTGSQRSACRTRAAMMHDRDHAWKQP